VNVQLIKYVDKTVGPLLTRLFSSPAPATLSTPEKILLIRPGGIGDAVHMIPLIKTLRMAYPAAGIDILAEKRNGAIFSLTCDVTNVFHYDTLSGLLSVFRRQYDLVIDTEQWHRLSAVMARFIGAKVTVGYATNERKNLFTQTASYCQDEYEADNFLNLLAPLHIPCRNNIAPPFLIVPESAKVKAAGLLGVLTGKPFAVLFPGASIEERRWGVQNFSDLAERLQEKGLFSVVIGGSYESADGNLIADRGNASNLAGKTTLIETAAVIDKAALLISGDSGILHIGVGLGKPTVSLFGPGRAKKWAPRGDKHIVINKCLPCSPCTSFGYTPKCPINAKCMADIHVDDVMMAVDKLVIFNGLRHTG
jgi:lipopolysaccharide heptosyltransferase II